MGKYDTSQDSTPHPSHIGLDMAKEGERDRSVMGCGLWLPTVPLEHGVNAPPLTTGEISEAHLELNRLVGQQLLSFPKVHHEFKITEEMLIEDRKRTDNE